MSCMLLLTCVRKCVLQYKNSSEGYNTLTLMSATEPPKQSAVMLKPLLSSQHCNGKQSKRLKALMQTSCKSQTASLQCCSCSTAASHFPSPEIARAAKPACVVHLMVCSCLKSILRCMCSCGVRPCTINDVVKDHQYQCLNRPAADFTFSA